MEITEEIDNVLEHRVIRIRGVRHEDFGFALDPRVANHGSVKSPINNTVADREILISAERWC